MNRRLPWCISQMLAPVPVASIVLIELCRHGDMLL
jgi:hypothetical protein